MSLGQGLELDHSTIYGWVQCYAPKMLYKLKWYWKVQLGYSWRLDETYVKVNGRWAFDKRGNTIDFYLSPTRNTAAAKRFSSKALRSLSKHSHPKSINTDKNFTYNKAITLLKTKGKCSISLERKQIKYLNNIIEADYKKLKRLIKPTLGFKSMKTTYIAIKGFELILMFKKGQFDL